MNRHESGKAWVFGDDVNTDYIISSKRKRDTLDPRELAKFLMEDIRPGFGPQVLPGDFLVGGKNFGCGSAMEIATTVIKGAGIQAILARSFSRTFFRNGINGGLLLVEVDTSDIEEGDRLSVNHEAGGVVVNNLSKGSQCRPTSNTPFIDRIVQAGGIIPYLKTHRGFE